MINNVVVKIRDNKRTSSNQQCLIFTGEQLRESHALSDFNIQMEFTHLVLRLCGGMPSSRSLGK